MATRTWPARAAGITLSSIGSGRAELQCRTTLARRSPIGSRGSSPTGGGSAGSAPGRTAPGLESQRGHRRGHGAVVGAGVLVGGDGELPRHTPGSREVVGAHALAVRVALSHDDTGAAGVDRRRRVQRPRYLGAAFVRLGHGEL